MLLRRQNQSRKPFLEEALLMCREHEKGRKAVEMNRGILRGGETAT